MHAYYLYFCIFVNLLFYIILFIVYRPLPLLSKSKMADDQAQAQDTQQGLRKLKGALWELGLAERHLNPTTGKSTCICKCKVDPNDPTIVHPLDWAKVIKMESEKSKKTAANKEVLVQVIAEQEGSIEEEEEDLATPGTSKKRPAPGEGDLFETPKAKRPAHHLSGKSLFHRVIKHNVKDKKQIYWDLRLTELMVGNNIPYEFVADDITKKWMEEFHPQYHLKHPTTFSR